MAREIAAAWSEGYATALRDFGIQLTDHDIEHRVSENPHERPQGRSRLSEHERREIRHALGYHFDDCPGDWDTQAQIMETITERILYRRPERTP